MKPIKGGDTKWRRQTVAAIKKQIIDLDDVTYKKIRNQLGQGKYEHAFPIASPADVKVGDLLRVEGRVTLIQILNNGALADYYPKGFKQQKMRVYLETKKTGGGADFRALNNNKNVFGQKVQVNFLGIRMPAANYLNMLGGQMAYIPLLNHKKYLSEEHLQSISNFLKKEDERREQLQKQKK